MAESGSRLGSLGLRFYVGATDARHATVFRLIRQL